MTQFQEVCDSTRIYCPLHSLVVETTLNKTRAKEMRQILKILLFITMLTPAAGFGQTEFEKIKALAEQGIDYAQGLTGYAYSNGEGVPQNYTEAMKWYLLAAEQGNSESQYNLGIMYDNGRGVPQNHTEAVKWYLLAAEQGNASGQYNLGVMYATGQGIPQNYAEAVRWYRLAAEQGHANAQNNLSGMYTNGRGVPQNGVRAYVWESLAAAQGLEQARKNRDISVKELTPEQLARGQDIAARCFASGYKDCN